MKAGSSLIAIGIFLSVLWVDAIALGNESSIFESAISVSNLEAPKLTVAIDETKVSLSWSQVTGATDYVVHYAQYPYDHPGTIQTVTVGDRTTTSLDLSPGDAYHFAVRACTDSGNDCSDYSNIHEVIIPPLSTFKNSLGQEFKLIPAGTFTMGSPGDEPGRESDEIQHQVTLTQPFYMQTTEVTQAQWEAVMGYNPSYFSECPTCPVEMVTWDDAQSYIAKMNQKGEGLYSLPTEAQWEYAARARSTTAFSDGAIVELECGDDPNLDAIGWYCYNSDYGTRPVGQKSPNAWGLHDMPGNVYEWCQDWYGTYPSGPVTDPAGPSSGYGRVARGGGWGADAKYCRSADRHGRDPGGYGSSLGFRLARDPMGLDSEEPDVFVIRGNITGDVKQGVTLVLTGHDFRQETSGADGTYEFSDLNNGYYAITPTKSKYVFTPASRSITISGADKTGIDFAAEKLSVISGVIKGDVNEGITLMLSGDATDTLKSRSDGSYAFEDLKKGTYAITPSLPKCAFTPATRSVTVSGTDKGDVNFTSRNLFDIRGRITGDASSGVPLTLSGHDTGLSTAGTDGDYRFTNLERGTYYITPILSEGFTLTPASRSVTLSNADASGVDFIATRKNGTGRYLIVDLTTGIWYTQDNAPSDLLTNGDYKTSKLVLRRIEAGTFVMGSPETEIGASYKEYWKETQHQVTLTKDFYMGVFEFTQEQYFWVMAHPSPAYFKGDKRPVETISFSSVRGQNDPQKSPHRDSVLGKLSALTGRKFDLPTEAQWEFACRAETIRAYNDYTKNNGEGSDCLTDDFYTKDGNLDPLGWYVGNTHYGVHGTKEVGLKQPNRWGLYDMHGNVAEGCRDWAQYDLGNSPATDPIGTVWVKEDPRHMSRGGSGGEGAPSAARSACRAYAGLDDPWRWIGFRVVITEDQ